MGMQRRLQTLMTHNNAIWSVNSNKHNIQNKYQFASVGDDGLLQLYE
jgi:hypothetical protein